MEKQEFKAESKRLLDLMINSIYTNKDIFLREIISNSSDAIDKVYYKTLKDENKTFNKDDYYINISVDKEKRAIIVEDTGIGMNKEDLINNLGTIAKSGSLQFKQENEIKENYDIIGQFGVGFYSSFMVAKKVSVLTKKLDDTKAYLWESEGVDGFTINDATKDKQGTIITIYLKDDVTNSENELGNENYSKYLEEYEIRSLIKKYSDFIRYPIKMEVTKSREIENKDNEDSPKFEEYKEIETINSQVPLWRKNKNELKKEDYIEFYKEKHYGFDEPLRYIHQSVDGVVRFQSIIYIPSMLPFNYYTKEFKRGLQLYSNGVLIMDKCEDLIPDYFGFVVGMVDSEDLSLNISREMLQNSRQLRVIGKRLKDKIKNELVSMLNDDRETYVKFYKEFNRSLKFGVYENFGANKEDLEDLLMFKSSLDKEKYTTLSEYVSRMKDDQKEIYYAVGDSIEKIEHIPQIEYLLDKGIEVLYFTDDVDEFMIKSMMTYKEKTFKSAQNAQVQVDEKEEKEIEEQKEKSKSMLEAMKEILKNKVSDVVISKRLKNSPVCFSTKGDLSIEMEKTLNMMPTENKIKAEKVLELNPKNKAFHNLEKFYETYKNLEDKDKTSSDFEKLTDVLYNNARLIEGLTLEDPTNYINNINQLLFK